MVFTSGGTEADNLAVLGVVAPRDLPEARDYQRDRASGGAGACAQLEREGVEVTHLPAGSQGVVDPGDVRRALRPDTVLVSVMHANNELGTVQPIAEIARDRPRGRRAAARGRRAGAGKDSGGCGVRWAWTCTP